MEGQLAVTGILDWVLTYATVETANVMGYFITGITQAVLRFESGGLFAVCF